MPINPHASMGTTLEELRAGPQYAATLKKYGKRKAEEQAAAIALSMHGKSKGKVTMRGKQSAVSRPDAMPGQTAGAGSSTLQMQQPGTNPNSLLE